MKKVLILLMVLGLSSASYALSTLTWSVDSVDVGVDSLVKVYIVADNNDPSASTWVGATSSTVAEIVNIVALSTAGDDNSITDYRGTYPQWWTVQSADISSPYSIASGNQYEVTIKGLAIGSETLYVGSDALTVTVPEPITIALLGLGGLLLRRRK